MNPVLRVVLSLATVAAVSPAPAWAVTVEPVPRTVRQPDGSALVVVPSGDERAVYWELPSGHTVMRDADGFWRLARLGRDGRLIAGVERADSGPSAALARMPRHLRPRPARLRGAGPPAPLHAERGEGLRALAGTPAGVPLLVILVEFSDRAPIGANAAAFQQAFFASGRSVASYYRDVTFGALEMTPAADSHGSAGDGIVGWFKLASKHPNRGITGSDSATDAQKDQAKHDARVAVKAAIEAANPYVDFAAYDANHDGGIAATELGVVVVTAGWEASFGGYQANYSPSNWGHRWSLGFADAKGMVASPVVDGVRVGDYRNSGGYTTFGEWMQTRSSDGHRATIGVMVHELGHDTLGLPDLYDSDGSSEGVGGWCLMGAGSWGSEGAAGQWSGDVPVGLSAWSKLIAGIVSPTDLTGAGSVTAPPGATAPVAFRLGTGADNEYLLVEHRAAVGWDAGLKRWDPAGFAAGGGLAIWHVDEYETTNEDEQHKLVDCEEADGLSRLDAGTSELAGRSMLFHAGGAVRFDDATVPDARRYDGGATGVQISGVGNESAAGITFDFVAPQPVGFAADECATAAAVTLAPGQEHSLAISLAQATSGDTPALCAPLSKTGWYRVTAERTGRLTVESAGFDTMAAVLGGGCGSLAVLGCNDDIDATGASRVAGIALRRGDSVHVVLGRYGSGRSIGAPLTGRLALAAADPLTVTATAPPTCADPRLDVLVEGASGGVGGLAASDFHALIDGEAAGTLSVIDRTGGRYELRVSAALAFGAHALRVEVDTATASGTTDLSLSCAGSLRRRLWR